MIEELIGLARVMSEASARGESLGLSDDELAFYDALETSASAVKVLGEPTLKAIARELVAIVRKNVTIDWTIRDNVRAQLRVVVKRILRKHGYQGLVGGIAELLEAARRRSARAVNELLTATYWEIGRRIVEFEQRGQARAEYGAGMLNRLATDLTAKFGGGFSYPNLSKFRQFYAAFPRAGILSTLSIESASPIRQTASGRFDRDAIRFPLPWSAYVRLLAVKREHARRFYETEALRGGWSVRQLERQINSQFYERTALSRDKAALLKRGARGKADDQATAEEEVKDPYVLEFLGLRDEYSETDLEQALIRHLESFLLELGGDFCFVGRQKRLRIGEEWFRVDLVFYHRRLRCLVLTDLKLGRFTHADAGQMRTYLNYAIEHWTHADENPPVGLILCAQRDEALAHYALGNLPSKVMAAEYRTVLPDEKLLAADLGKARQMLERRGIGRQGSEPRV